MGILTTLDEDRVAIFDSELRLVDASDAWAQFGSSSGLGSRPDGNSEELQTMFQLPSQPSELEHLKIAVNRLSAGTQKHFRFNYLSEVNATLRIFEFSLLSEGQKRRLRIEARHRDVTTVVDGAVVLPLVSDFLDNVREDERRRMAAELHDSTVQHLTAVNLNIINLRRELAQGKNTEKLIGVIEESGEAAQDEIRLFSYLTFPCQLEAEGFKSTIEHYLVGFARRSHLNIAFHIPSRVDTVPVALQHALLRITQEGLSNVHRHASAHRVTVTLAMKDQKLSLKIDDDGHGILPTNTDKRIDRGVGMQSMTARLREFDGSLRLMSSSKGTSLIAEVPLRSALRHQLDVSHRFVGSLPKRPVNWEIKTGTTSRGRCNKPRALQSLTT